MKSHIIFLLISAAFAFNGVKAQTERQDNDVNSPQSTQGTAQGSQSTSHNSQGFTVGPVHSQGFTINFPRRRQNTSTANTNRPGGFQSSSTRQVTENGFRQTNGGAVRDQRSTGRGFTMERQAGGQINSVRPNGGQMGAGHVMGVARR